MTLQKRNASNPCRSSDWSFWNCTTSMSFWSCLPRITLTLRSQSCSSCRKLVIRTNQFPGMIVCIKSMSYSLIAWNLFCRVLSIHPTVESLFLTSGIAESTKNALSIYSAWSGHIIEGLPRHVFSLHFFLFFSSTISFILFLTVQRICLKIVSLITFKDAKHKRNFLLRKRELKRR